LGWVLLPCMVESLRVGGVWVGRLDCRLHCLYTVVTLRYCEAVAWIDPLTCCAGDQHTYGLGSSPFASWTPVQQVTCQTRQHRARSTGDPYVYATRYLHVYSMHALSDNRQDPLCSLTRTRSSLLDPRCDGEQIAL
jgi:hypothetical protein